MSKNFSLGLISKSSEIRERLSQVSKEYEYTLAIFDNPDSCFNTENEFDSLTCFIVDCSESENQHEAAGHLQVARQMVPQAYIVAVLDSKSSAEVLEFFKKSGANLVLLSNEIIVSSKLEFISSQIIKTAYLSLKPIDLVPNTSLDCDLYHMLPLNKKFLKVFKKGSKVDADFVEKYGKISDLFFKKNDLDIVNAYIESHFSNSEEDLLRKTRFDFMKLQQSFIELALLISDTTTSSSFQDGKVLFDTCQKFAERLYNNLIGVKEPWKVIDNSAVGGFGSIERSTAISAYAGIFAKKANYPSPIEAMLAGLLADIGLLLITNTINYKIRMDKESELTPEEKVEYEKHPIFSLNQVLSKKIQISENIKQAILCSHERGDQKGFPNQVPSAKINDLAQFVRLAWEVDSGLCVRIGKVRNEPQSYISSYMDRIAAGNDGYSLPIVMTIRKNLNS